MTWQAPTHPTHSFRAHAGLAAAQQPHPRPALAPAVNVRKVRDGSVPGARARSQGPPLVHSSAQRICFLWDTLGGFRDANGSG
jgi:hypothetical protein